VERHHFGLHTYRAQIKEGEKRRKVILSQYRCERQKVKNMKNSEMGTDETASTTWFAHKVLVFAGRNQMRLGVTMQEV
jgi:hypothetical protein